MRKILLWLLAAAFAVAAAAVLIMMFFPFRGMGAVLASVAAAALLLLIARHFAVLALRWRPTLGPEGRMKAAAEMASVTRLPVVARPTQLKLRPGEVCHFQAMAKYFPDGDRGTFMNKAPSYPGWFSITSQRVTMGGLKSFTVPIEDVLEARPYRYWQGICLRAVKGELLVTMDGAYQIPRILELMGVSPQQGSHGEPEVGPEDDPEEDAPEEEGAEDAAPDEETQE